MESFNILNEDTCLLTKIYMHTSTCTNMYAFSTVRPLTPRAGPDLTCWAWGTRRSNQAFEWSIHQKLCWWQPLFSPGGAGSLRTGGSPLWGAACPGKEAACGWRSKKTGRGEEQVKSSKVNFSFCAHLSFDLNAQLSCCKFKNGNV